MAKNTKSTKKTSTKTRNIPKRNYLITILVVLGTLLLTFYIFEWYKVYQENKVTKSYLVSTDTVLYEITTLEEAKSVLSETPNDYFVYVSYVNSKETYELEKNLKPIIDEYGLKNNFYFLNVTDIMKNSNYLDQINETLNLTTYKITTVPTIVYFEDDTVSVDSILKREDKKMIEAADFKQFLDIKEIVKDSH